MIRFALGSVASLLVLAAVPATSAQSPIQEDTAAERYCYEECFNACRAKGGTNPSCEFECASAPPCDSGDCEAA